MVKIAYVEICGQSCIYNTSAVNVKNKDNRFFESVILCALYSVQQNAHCPATYQAHLCKLNLHGVAFPVKVSNIGKLEHQNPTIAVSVFEWKDGRLYPIRVSSKTRDSNVKLLLLASSENEHYDHRNGDSENKKCP